MNTQDFIQTLKFNTEKELRIILPDGDKLQGDLHITEIKNQSIESVDCGANAHSFKETVMQMYVNENNEKQAYWTTEKALSIIDKVNDKKSLHPESEFFIEYGDKKRPTVKYSVEDIHTSDDLVEVALNVKPVSCKPATHYSQSVICC